MGNRKFNLRFLLLFVVMLFALSTSVFAATTKKTVSVKTKASTVKLSMTAGDKMTLTVKDGKKVITNKAKYTSSKKSAATVSKKGVITAKKKGTAVIKVQYRKKSVRLKVIVKKASAAPTPTPAPRKTPEEQYKETMEMVNTPPKDYAELERRYPHSQYGTVRVYPNLLRPTFGSTIKFNTVYYIYSEDDRTFSGNTFITTITTPGRDTLTNEAACHISYGWTSAWVDGIAGGTPLNKYNEYGKKIEDKSTEVFDRVFLNKDWHNNNTPFIKSLTNGKVPVWADYMLMENAVFIFGALDNQKTFFFYVEPNFTTGHCTENINIMSTQFRYSPNDFVHLYSLKLDDYNG